MRRLLSKLFREGRAWNYWGHLLYGFSGCGLRLKQEEVEVAELRTSYQ